MPSRHSKKSHSKSLRGGRRPRNSQGQPLEPKCAGQEDPFSTEPIDEANAIRLLENGHYFCFDIRQLYEAFSRRYFVNPSTRVPWSDANKAKIRRKFGKMNFAPLPTSPAAAAAAAAAPAAVVLSPSLRNIIYENMEKGIWLVKPRNGELELELNEFSSINVRTPFIGQDFYVLTPAVLVIVPSNWHNCQQLRSYINSLQSEDDVEESDGDLYRWE